MSRSPLRGPGEIAEDEAAGELAATYTRLREVLGVPFIPTVHRMLGVYGRYLAAAVEEAAPLIAGEAGARFAAEARRTSTEAVAGMSGSPLDAGADHAAVEALIDRYNEANPRNLLFVVALAPQPAAPLTVMPVDLPQPPALADANDAILADVLRCHGGFTTPGFWRELAAWPDLFAAAWEAVRPLARDRRFHDARAAVRELAGAAAVEVVPPDPAALGYDSDDVAAIARILTFFEQAITSMVVEIEIVRGLLERG